LNLSSPHRVSASDCIETERLLIRPFRRDDLPQVIARATDPAVTRYTGGAISPDEARQRLESAIRHFQERAPLGPRAVVLKAGGVNVGYCTLSPLPHSAVERIELAYGLTRAHWGHGYATESGAAMLKVGFGAARLTEIVAAIHPLNVASLRVVERLGFTRREQLDWPDQGKVGLYVLTKGEYERNRA
jgi:RimJ/RimL family protein N-acetyltransferase